MRKNCLPLLTLTLLDVLLICWVVPAGHVFGSHTDWLAQHVALAETIRDACLTQRTLLPNWLVLGGGSNGYQFACYGFLRPDVLLGCLLPKVSMTPIFLGYCIAVGLSSVLLCYLWLYKESGRREVAWLCGVLLMTAGCLFQLHRQIMFVNYLPFLLLAFLCVKCRRKRWLPLCLLLICTSSFYYAPACFMALGWYWYRCEGKRFWSGWLGMCFLAAGMAAMLLVPTAVALLAHRSASAGGVNVLSLLTPNWALSSLLVSPYGMGLSLVALYALLAALGTRKWLADAVLLLLITALPLASYLLNGTLYARAKILVPFTLLVLLVVARIFTVALRGKLRLPLWPLAVLLFFLAYWQHHGAFRWLALEWGILLFLALRQRLGAGWRRWLVLLLIAPLGLYSFTASSEDWVREDELSQGLSAEALSHIEMDARYHYDSLLSPLAAANKLPTALGRSSMYSSLINQSYAQFYYDVLEAPIQINNRVALLTANDPFLFHLTGARYLETSADQVPEGYTVIASEGHTVLAEKPDVLPVAYFTKEVVNEAAFDGLSAKAKLDTLARTTVVEGMGSVPPDAGTMQRVSVRYHLAEPLPAGLSIEKIEGGWDIRADRTSAFTLLREEARTDDLLLLDVSVDNHTNHPVTMTINGVKNRLSGASAPYPNGNDRFHFKLSEARTLHITLSAGHYTLKNLSWSTWDMAAFQEKQMMPITLTDPERHDAVVSGNITAMADGVLATTIPMQHGLSLYIDGKPTPLRRVNTAFAGASLSAGTHSITLCFTPPGKHLGLVLSAISALCYFSFLRRKN